MSKYKLPNGLIVNLDDETGATTVVGGGGRTVAPGARVTDEGILGAAPTGAESRAVSRPSDQQKPAPSDEEIDNPGAPLAGGPAPVEYGGHGNPVSPALIHEDPIGTVITAGPAAKLGGALGAAAPGLIQKGIQAAVGVGIPTLVDTGSPREAAQSALVASALPAAGPLRRLATTGAPGNFVREVAPAAVASLAENAAARQVANTVPGAINAGTRTAAAKRAVGASPLIHEALNADPELSEIVNSGAGPAEKAAAIDTKLDELEGANTEAHKTIAASHPDAIAGRLPVSRPVLKLQELANKAHDAGNDDLREAAYAAIEKLNGFADHNGLISPEQIRGVRNKLAKSVAKRSGLALSDVAEETAAVKATLNDAISDLAAETPDVAGKLTDLKTRDRQIAGLIAAKDSLEAQAGAESLKVQHPIATAARAIAHPKETLVHAAERAPSVIDQHLASLAGPAGQAGVDALKQVVLRPSRQSLQQAVAAGIPAGVALKVARLGTASIEPAGAQ